MFEVAAERLNAAIVAKPTKILTDITWHEFTREPLFIIAPPGTPKMPFEELLTKFPFIRFHRDVPLAHIIDAEIGKMGIQVRPSIEIDTIYGIVQCVTNGLGVSVAPHTAIFNSRPVDIVPFPFGNPQIFREIGIIERRNNPKEPLIKILHDKLAQLSEPFGIYR
jgi:DNA-binding transcriptional LysR family regulator